MVSRARVLNSLTGITGMLWCDDENFAQVLEGPHDHVGETMERIGRDVRHTDLAIVFDRAVGSRIFGDWGMKRSDTSLECTASTAFLIGLAANENTPPARRLSEIMLASDG